MTWLQTHDNDCCLLCIDCVLRFCGANRVTVDKEINEKALMGKCSGCNEYCFLPLDLRVLMFITLHPEWERDIVFESVCLSVCLSASNFTKKLLDHFLWNFQVWRVLFTCSLQVPLYSTVVPNRVAQYIEYQHHNVLVRNGHIAGPVK